jgi:hypothetical protein
VGILGLDDTRYLATPQQSRTDATAVFGGTLAVGRDELTLAAAYLDRHEDRTSIDVLPSDTRWRTRCSMCGRAIRWCWIGSP